MTNTYYHGRSNGDDSEGHRRRRPCNRRADAGAGPRRQPRRSAVRRFARSIRTTARAREYHAVRKVLAARDGVARAAVQVCGRNGTGTTSACEQFHGSARFHRLRADRAAPSRGGGGRARWQTEDDWAKGPEPSAAGPMPFFKEFDAADLRGLGGRGSRPARSGRTCAMPIRSLRRREADDRAFIVVNGDESEPGTFKDREILLHQCRTPSSRASSWRAC